MCFRKKLTDRIYYKKSKPMEGGNARVYNARFKGEDGFVVKILNETKGKEAVKKLKRFKTEIKTVSDLLANCKGVIPILEYDFDRKTDKFYLMPFAKRIDEYFKDREQSNNTEIVKQKVKAILEISETLEVLHNMDIHHRDIKPENLFFYNNSFCLSDFGLVDVPNKEGITKDNERIGPQGYIPPEMLYGSFGADFKKVDLYELAKTLWALLANKKAGFSGKYNPDDKTMGLTFLFATPVHLVEIEDLLVKFTENDPNLRPNISEFKKLLQNWLTISENGILQAKSQWNHINNKLFPTQKPETAIFKEIDTIISVINYTGRQPGLNHMMHPSGGGMTFKSAKPASEQGFIEIELLEKNAMESVGIHCPNIVLKPKKLYLENISPNSTWNYFRLEAETIEPISTKQSEYSEYLFVLPDGTYTSSPQKAFPMPKTIERLLGGVLLFVSKYSIYNQTSATYDARHSKMNYETFKLYMTLSKVINEIHPEKYDCIFNKYNFPIEPEAMLDLIQKELEYQ